MAPTRFEQTLRREVSVSGFGYWSGRDITVKFRPAPVGTGIVFERCDLPGAPRVSATIENRTSTLRRTNLRSGPAEVDMVEHVLAALAGLQISNCIVAVDQSEMPGFDGSSRVFAEALRSVGTTPQYVPRRRLIVTRSIRLHDGQSWIEAHPATGEETVFEYHLDYPDSPAIGKQQFVANLGATDFFQDIAPARTFLTRREAMQIRSQGRGDRVDFCDLLIFDESGPIDNILRFENECARHKLLDMIGDFSLLGCELVGNVSAYRSGHQLNALMVAQLLSAFSIERPQIKAA